MKISLRAKLVISFLAVIIICGLVATLAAIRLIGTGIISQAQDRVRIDLNVAGHIYQDEIQEVGVFAGGPNEYGRGQPSVLYLAIMFRQGLAGHTNKRGLYRINRYKPRTDVRLWRT